MNQLDTLRQKIASITSPAIAFLTVALAYLAGAYFLQDYIHIESGVLGSIILIFLYGVILAISYGLLLSSYFLGRLIHPTSTTANLKENMIKAGAISLSGIAILSLLLDLSPLSSPLQLIYDTPNYSTYIFPAGLGYSLLYLHYTSPFSADMVPSKENFSRLLNPHSDQPEDQETDSISQEQLNDHIDPTEAEQNSDDQSPLTDLEYDWQYNSGVSFADVGGMDDLKRTLYDEVIKPYLDTDKAKQLGITPPNIIFYGPPGTGKTHLAKALATEVQLPYVKLSGGDITTKWINESSSRVNLLFREAKAIAAQEGGAIIFLDEIDTILQDRSSASSSHTEDLKIVNEFLNHLENINENGIIFIGATNRIDALDKASMRAGRIDKKIKVGKPDLQARYAVLETQLEKRAHSITDTEIEEIAAKTDGLVPADLTLLVDQAAKETFRRDGDAITTTDLQTALDSL